MLSAMHDYASKFFGADGGVEAASRNQGILLQRKGQVACDARLPFQVEGRKYRSEALADIIRADIIRAPWTPVFPQFCSREVPLYSHPEPNKKFRFWYYDVRIVRCADADMPVLRRLTRASTFESLRGETSSSNAWLRSSAFRWCGPPDHRNGHKVRPP